MNPMVFVLAAAAPLFPPVAPEALRADVTFLASDLLEGRDTPSRGLDIAANYIGAQFQKTGLKPAGDDGYFQTATWTAAEVPMTARNVVGILEGSDAELKGTYVMVTAHYDHIGMTERSLDDKIFNGANDNASGTAGVLALAEMFGNLKVRPKRSILFIAFFGEEKGLLGSRWYGKHPVVPLKHTVAGINLEQIGRTDDTEGGRVAAINLTGYDFSDLGAIFLAAGRRTTTCVEKHPRYSDLFFGRSDNQAIADAGVPSTTVSVAYDFPDYHGLGDHADKLDYGNMAGVVRTVGQAVLTIANDKRPPRWNEANPKTAKYVEAAKRLLDGH